LSRFCRDLSTAVVVTHRSQIPAARFEWAATISLNNRIVAQLREAADLLEQQHANPFRVQTYRHAVKAVAGLGENVNSMYRREGIEGLDARSGIGPSLAGAIAQMIQTGRRAQPDRVRGAVAPEELFQANPGIWPGLVRGINEHLNVDSLEALEAAAHDGPIEAVPGIGSRPTAMLRAALAGLLSRTCRVPREHAPEPAADILLDIDREYPEKAPQDALPKIVSRRLNPSDEAWLPALHTERAE
jgi:DNA polymerase/3'-5' exonuclease PolX